jgi:hypothetical protein
MKYFKNRKGQIVALSIAGVLLLSGSVYAGFAWGREAEQSSSTLAYGNHMNAGNSSGATQHEEGQTVTPLSTDLSQAQTDKLLYLIEEEKLAHDVYVNLYDKYGARVFDNISKSETRHQDALLALLEARNIEDPRSNEVGVFSNPDLQKLYDTLMEKGNKSAQDAYEVGKLIEETDIADIDKDLALFSSDNSDVVTTLQNLRKGSENHLRAFTRQLG